jgi:ABC-type molybdenum transport system ATPase subunit/photorepair protein PhrA
MFYIELAHHHVLAGANCSGKTTLLDIPTLFGELILLDRRFLLLIF